MPTAEEREAARTVARSLAIALGDPGARAYLKRALASSAAKENKLHLSSFIAGRGAPVLANLKGGEGGTIASVTAALAAVRDLELYMPVRTHRVIWTEASEPLVAVALHESDAPEAFDVRGVKRVLGREIPPAQPVLALVPVETDLRSQAQLNALGRAEVECTPTREESLETASQRCMYLHARRPSGLEELDMRSDGIVGLYATELLMNGDQCGGECWSFGDPEYEIFVMGRWSRSINTMDVLECAGDKEPAPNYFDAGNHWAGKVQLLSLEQLERNLAVDSTFMLHFWEDDAWHCKIAYDGSVNELVAMVGLGALGAVAGWRWVRDTTREHRDRRAVSIGVSWLIAAVSIGSAISSWVQGGDDLIGIGVERSSTPNYIWGGVPERFNVMIVNNQGQTRTGAAVITLFDANGPYVGPVTHVVLATAGHPEAMPVNTIKSYAALPFDQYYTPVPGKTPSWQSSNPSVATISSTGHVTGHALGTTTITATIDGVSASRTLYVVTIGGANEIYLEPDLALEVGQMGYMVARAYDMYGFEIPTISASDFRWTSSSPGSCSGLGNGSVYADAPPGATITIELDGLTASRSCFVAPPGGNVQ